MEQNEFLKNQVGCYTNENDFEMLSFFYYSPEIIPEMINDRLWFHL